MAVIARKRARTLPELRGNETALRSLIVDVAALIHDADDEEQGNHLERARMHLELALGRIQDRMAKWHQSK